MDSDRLENNEPAKSLTESLVPKYVEMAMGLNWSSDARSKEHYYDLGDNYFKKMASRGLIEDDLLEECLNRAETSMLLTVSLDLE